MSRPHTSDAPSPADLDAIVEVLHSMLEIQSMLVEEVAALRERLDGDEGEGLWREAAARQLVGRVSALRDDARDLHDEVSRSAAEG